MGLCRMREVLPPRSDGGSGCVRVLSPTMRVRPLEDSYSESEKEEGVEFVLDPVSRGEAIARSVSSRPEDEERAVTAFKLPVVATEMKPRPNQSIQGTPGKRPFLRRSPVPVVPDL